MTDQLLLRIPEVASRLAVSEREAYRMVDRGDFPSVKMGKLRRVRVVDLEQFVRRLAAGDHAHEPLMDGGRLVCAACGVEIG